MKTIKIIDLLIKANNGEIIKKIKFNSIEYEYHEGQDDWMNMELRKGLLDRLLMTYQLNEVVEIIEEEENEIGKIPLIRHKDGCKRVDCDALQYKIDELIDAVNELKRGN